SPIPSSPNKYLYNGKELQEETGDYDYGARHYDPVIAKWTAIDPMAETFEHTSAYAYVLNNPINLGDYDGRDTIKMLQEVTVTAKRSLVNPPIPVYIPYHKIEPIQTLKPGAPPLPNPLLAFLSLVLTPQNSLDDHSEKDALEKMHKAKKEGDLIEEVLTDAKPGRKTKGRVKQYDKEGGLDKANEDFDKLVDPKTVRPIPAGRQGQTPNGTMINVRSVSSDGRPTFEIQTKNPIKIRYDN
ncbi:RHS repeat-associated core domain-containing protein, partial [uncultured Mucilaginibacter sp.]